MKKYILSLDQGTTSSRAILFTPAGEPVAVAQKEFRQIFPHEGWVEHDAEEIWSTQLEVARRAIEKAGASAEEIYGIGITNQRETTVIWDRKTGKPVYNAIVWQCRRTADFCEALKKDGLTEPVRRKTGLIIDPYFSGTKIRWILENVPGARERAERGELCFGTIDTWLIWNLTDGRVHATDYSNASRTMLFNMNTLEWDGELLRLLGIPASLLPEARPSSGDFGITASSLFGAPIPVAGVAGDQQAALFGQCCFKEGNVKNTYGTGGFLLMNTGNKPVFSENGLVTTVAWGLNGEVNYALEGSVFICGAAVQWLRDGMGLVKSAAETEDIARSVKDSGGVYFVPAFVGLGAPYWNPHARGAVFGITRGTTRAHIIRAVLESMAYQTADVIGVMQKDSGIYIPALNVDGGASANNLLLETQANLLGRRIVRPSCVESTAMGAAFLAGLATGAISSTDEIAKKRSVSAEFAPSLSDAERIARMDGWHKAIKGTCAFAE
ncbi:MAG: glycerol kinase GlpK [Clostridia bacterium]|nr:glycerol kinase GlpK [Clostridia bacterium]